jgi:uncharacterized protein
MRNEEFLKKIKQAVLTIDDKAQVILFGSRARGDAETDSDWDILVLTTKKPDDNFHQQLVHKTVQIELDTSQCISAIVKNTQEWESKYAITPLYRSIKLEGIKL